MAMLVLEKNKDVIEKDVLKEAKERIQTKNTKKKSSQTKEVKANEQEKVKRAGRPRKSA